MRSSLIIFMIITVSFLINSGTQSSLNHVSISPNNLFQIKNQAYGNISQSNNTSSLNFFKSPLQQFKSGIPINEIKCKDRLNLVIKSSNENPACVKAGSMKKLIEVGWAVTKSMIKKVKLTGDDAWAICGAMKIPCVSEPVFYGTKQNGSIVVDSSILGNAQQILLNKTHVCVAEPNKKIECKER